MKYLCLAYYDEKKFDALPATELDAIVKQCASRDEALRKSGRLLAVGSLAPPRASTSLRPRGGKPLVIDGPFAEAKEAVGAFFPIEADDGDEAVRVASLHPAAQLGERVGWGVEVRPVETCDQL